MRQPGEKKFCNDSAALTEGCEVLKKQISLLLRSGQALVFAQEADLSTVEIFPYK
jgi:hypothetical protein